MLSLQDDVNSAGKVASGATSAMIRAILVGLIPIVEFGFLIALTLLVVAVPIKLVNMVVA